MAAPVVTFVAGQDVWNFTEQANVTGSTFLHKSVRVASFTDDNLTFAANMFSVDINYAYIPNPPVVPGLLLVTGNFLFNSAAAPRWTGSVTFDFSVQDKQLDFLREGQVLSQQIKVKVWDNVEHVPVEKVIKINVTGKNDKPKANVDIRTISEDVSAYTYKVIGNDKDPDLGDTLKVTSSSVFSVTSAAATYLTPAMVAIQNVTFVNNTSTSLKDSIKVTLNKAFQGLATGENALVVIKYTITDNLGAASASEFRLTVTGSNDTQIIGTNNADPYLFGEKDADTIYGLNGNDIIRPRGGVDVIYGGTGKDKFVFTVKGDSALANPDDIKDFKRTEGDQIDISAMAATTFQFRGTGAFNGGPDVRYVVKSGYLQVEVDNTGDKVADMKIDVFGVTSLVATDFVL